MLVISDRTVERQELMASFTLCSLSELYTLMKDQDDGVKELKLEQDNRVFNHCFTGTPFSDLLQ